MLDGMAELRGSLAHAGVLCSLIAALGGCGDDGELALVGTVERTLIELVAPASEVIVEIRAERGAPVASGEVIVRLDPTLARADVAQAEAAIAAAKAARVVAGRDLERLAQLSQRGVASTQDRERAELARDEAEARHREAEARLAAARKRLDDLDLRTPTAGVLDQLPFDLGERVPAGATLAVVLASEQPWVRVWVPEPSRAGVASGTPARIEVDGVAEPMRGRVRDVSREPEFTPHYALTERDRVHLVYEARVTVLDAPDNLPAGLPARVFLTPNGSVGAAP
jgi:HlyD family secretion protein